MGEKRGDWTVLSKDKAFENPYLELHTYEGIRPDGLPGHYGVVSPKSWAILVLPIFADGTTMLVGQHRFPLDRYSWEIPEGGGSKNLPPVESAKRELKEETGLIAGAWKEVLQAELSNSVTDEEGFGFLAWNLSEGEAEPEGTEVLRTQRLPFMEALDWVMRGEIRDLPSVAMILKAHYMAQKGDLPEALANAMLKG